MSVEGHISKELQIYAGVSKVSCLGPLLFIIYINDVLSYLKLDGLIYADDTTLIATGEDTHSTTTVLKENLEKIRLWSNNWKIKFNADQ